MRVLIMAGGTGGHVYPALAVALQLIELGNTVHWLGVGGSFESRVAQQNNIKFHAVPVSGLRGKGLLRLICSPFQVLRALIYSIYVVWTYNPKLVLGLGGYVSGPGGIAAWLFGKTLIIHEQNAIAGMTNKILARFSQKVLEAFPHSFGRTINGHLTGNPLRREFSKILPPEQRFRYSDGFLKILVLGGSGGAMKLNQVLPDTIAKLHNDKIRVWHQTGVSKLEPTIQNYKAHSLELGPNLRVVAYIKNMANAFAWADVVVCRAGALTIAEIACAGVASILVPYPYAVDDHQRANAEYLVGARAAYMLLDEKLNADSLVAILRELLANPAKLVEMAKAARKQSKPHATDEVVDLCLA